MAKTTKTAGTPATQEEAIDWGQYQTTGYENVSQEDLGIPFLTICQKGNPEIDEDHADYETKKIPGIKIGSIFNTASREIVHSPGDAALRVIPVGTKTLFVEWTPRTQGGGIITSHTDPAILNKCKRNEKGEDVLPSGNIIVRTQYFFVLLPDYPSTDGGLTRAIVSLTSTQLKKGRMWLNMMMARKIPGTSTPLPMFSHVYLITSVPEKNDKGNWRGWKIDADEMISDKNLIDQGKEAAASVHKNMNMLLPSSNSEETTEVVNDDGPF